MSKERGRILVGYRQSSAAGIHRSAKPRTQIEREALESELQEVSVGTVFLFPSDPFLDDDLDWDEPTDQDLLDIEDDDWEDDDRLYDLGSDYYGDGDDRYPFDDYDYDDDDYDDIDT